MQTDHDWHIVNNSNILHGIKSSAIKYTKKALKGSISHSYNLSYLIEIFTLQQK